MSTFNDLNERIRSDLTDRVPVTFSNEELFTYAKEGAALIFNYVVSAAPKYLSVKTTSTLSAEEYELAFTDVMYVVHRVYVTGSDGYFYPVIKNDLQTVMESVGSSGMPSMYDNYGRTLIFAPTADSDYTITIFYIPKYIAPTTFSASLGISSEFDSLIVDYVVIRAHNRNMRQPVIEQQFFNLKSDTIRQVLNMYQDSKINIVKGMFTSKYSPKDW